MIVHRSRLMIVHHKAQNLSLNKPLWHSYFLDSRSCARCCPYVVRQTDISAKPAAPIWASGDAHKKRLRHSDKSNIGVKLAASCQQINRSGQMPENRAGETPPDRFAGQGAAAPSSVDRARQRARQRQLRCARSPPALSVGRSEDSACRRAPPARPVPSRARVNA
jgi:hypothetical protein